MKGTKRYKYEYEYMMHIGSDGAREVPESQRFLDFMHSTLTSSAVPRSQK
jgi:hypothetical protein